MNQGQKRIVVVLAIVTALVAVLPAPIDAQGAWSSVTYVGSTLDGVGVCTAPNPTGVVIAGACNLVPPRNNEVRITVRDEIATHPHFRWSFNTAELASCGTEGRGVSEAVVEIPSGCTGVNVWLKGTLTTGTITLT